VPVECDKFNSFAMRLFRGLVLPAQEVITISIDPRLIQQWLDYSSLNFSGVSGLEMKSLTDEYVLDFLMS
jgi:hypothetical protein